MTIFVPVEIYYAGSEARNAPQKPIVYKRQKL